MGSLMGFLTRVGQRRSIPWTQSAPLGLARERGGGIKERGAEGGTGRSLGLVSTFLQIGRGLYSGKFWFSSGHLARWGL